MICQNCEAINLPDSVICTTCGNRLHPGQPIQTGQPPLFLPSGEITHYATPPPPPPQKDNRVLWLFAGALVAAVAVAAVFLLRGEVASSEVLPQNLGMYVQTPQKDRVDEISRENYTDAREAKKKLIDSGSLTKLTAQPELILYADANDNFVDDLKLVPLDSLSDDGTIKTLKFQVAPIDGKPGMKRIRFSSPIAAGKYSFILFDGSFNDGRHRFWPFEVRDSSKADNGDALKSESVSLKPTPAAPPRTAPVSVPPPPGARSSYVTGNGVRMRSGPGSATSIIGQVSRGQLVYVLGYAGYECPQGANGCGQWANVQTQSGKRGWVHSTLLR